ncbi:MAG: lysophospholipid acyltransferase family protein [Planctomycetota bacterium]
MPSTPGGPSGEPEGSAYDRDNGRRPSKSLKRRLRGRLSWPLVGLVSWLFPYLYYAYCWFVWRTSRVHDELSEPIREALARHGRVVSLMWHEEVFTTAYAYGPLDGHALVSTSNFGRIVTRMLELCGTRVFRGGSSRGIKRRRQVLPDMIRHMQTSPRCLYGITVDGSRGPAYRMKTGGLVIARTCRAPIYLVRTWYSRRVHLRNWDRSAIPLPFGRIYLGVVGPFWLEPDGSDAELERAHEHLERELLELAELSQRSFEGPEAAARGRGGFPPDWAPRWVHGAQGIPLGAHDLRPDAPPPWAAQAYDVPLPAALAEA